MQFQNLNSLCKPKGIKQLIKWKLTTPASKWPYYIPVKQYDIPPNRIIEADLIRISFIGHVTFFIQTNNLNILTDPVWNERASPFKFIGPKRVTPPGIKFNDLPKIDIILISHNHYDHLDLATIKKLCELYNPIIITPLKNDIILKKHISNVKVITLNWEEQIFFNSDLDLLSKINFNSLHNNFASTININKFKYKLSITLKPAQHWSARGLFDTNKTLWGSFIIDPCFSDLSTIFFIGDSGYNQALYKTIGEQHKIFISLLPIGAFAPRWFMQDVHMDPNEAALTHKDLKSNYSIASHFNTFPLASDHYNQSVNEMYIALNKNNISLEQFIIPEIGKAYNFNIQN